MWKWNEHNKGSHFRHNCRSVAFLSDRVKQTDGNVAIWAPGATCNDFQQRNHEITFTLQIHHLENIQTIFSVYFPTNALCNITHLIHLKTPTCFGTQVPSSGSNYKISVRANMLIYVLFIIISLIKTSVVKLFNNINI